MPDRALLELQYYAACAEAYAADSARSRDFYSKRARRILGVLMHA